jgi:hypothetical protein
MTTIARRADGRYQGFGTVFLLINVMDRVLGSKRGFDLFGQSASYEHRRASKADAASESIGLTLRRQHEIDAFQARHRKVRL